MLPEKQDILRKNNFLVNCSVWLILNFYRPKIKPILVNKRNLLCSYYPDCSEYSILALRKYGFFKGWAKAIRRISKCKTYRHNNSCIDYP